VKTILITGCSSGIGRHCALRLHELGYRVFATARRADDVEALAALGLDSLPLDLDDSASIAQALETVLQRTGGTLDALFNNAAYGQPGAVEDLSRDVLRAQLETNLLGTLELTNRVLPVMRRQGHGRIIMNSSVLGLIALKYRGAYNCSKFALEGLTDTLRLELAGSGIHVSLIEPGPITSAFRENAFRAFQQHIDVANSAHRETYEAVVARLSNQAPDQEPPFTLSPEAVLKPLRHALESRRPRARYYVTFPTYLLGTLRRLLPTAWLDRILIRASD
jgi:NAD(P)-dependent dehydrogenase (short-subunit alcohol dehydrogenase family)